MKTVFPAYAGVFLSAPLLTRFLVGLPRIRGGVSCEIETMRRTGRSSPHTRGCFYRQRHVQGHLPVFPAYAGVFPRFIYLSTLCPSLPRIRGGVSAHGNSRNAYVQSSPHTRGCFPRTACRRSAGAVFPAYAGVFPLAQGRGVQIRGLPRIRGGVSFLICHTVSINASSPHTRGCFRCYFQKMKKPIERSTGYFVCSA